MAKAKSSKETPAAGEAQTVHDSAVPLTAYEVRRIVEETFKSYKIAPPREIIGFDDLVARLPLGARTLREEIKKGRIASIRLPGARRLMFDWDNVQRSLLRYEKGGIQHAE